MMAAPRRRRACAGLWSTPRATGRAKGVPLRNGAKVALNHMNDEEKAAAVTSLHWDHVAVSRRLAQLEDRLLDAAEDLKLDTATDNGSEDTEVKTLFLFPGLDRFEKGKAI